MERADAALQKQLQNSGGQYAIIRKTQMPHRGCEFVDYLLHKIPQSAKHKMADVYKGTLRKLRDTNPDFIAAVQDLGFETCRERDKTMQAPDGVYCHSVGAKLNKATNGAFSLNFTHLLVQQFDGANDGLVDEASFRFGEDDTLLTVDGPRGISHGDVIDLNRENIPGFDVREYYVQLVADLKQRGL